MRPFGSLTLEECQCGKRYTKTRQALPETNCKPVTTSTIIATDCVAVLAPSSAVISMSYVLSVLASAGASKSGDVKKRTSPLSGLILNKAPSSESIRLGGMRGTIAESYNPIKRLMTGNPEILLIVSQVGIDLEQAHPEPL